MTGFSSIPWTGLNEIPLASAARTTSSDSGALSGYGPAQSIRAQLAVTAASGTVPTLDVTIQDSLDGINWNTIGTFTQATGVTQAVINVTSPFADLLRVKYVIAGTTPSFTFAVQWIVQV